MVLIFPNTCMDFCLDRSSTVMVWKTAGMVVMSPVPAPPPPSTHPPVQRDNSSVATPSLAYPMYGAAMARMTVAMVLTKTIAVSTKFFLLHMRCYASKHEFVMIFKLCFFTPTFSLYDAENQVYYLLPTHNLVLDEAVG